MFRFGIWGEIVSEVEVFLFFHRPVFSRDNYEEFMTIKAHVFCEGHKI